MTTTTDSKELEKRDRFARLFGISVDATVNGTNVNNLPD